MRISADKETTTQSRTVSHSAKRQDYTGTSMVDRRPLISSLQRLHAPEQTAPAQPIAAEAPYQNSTRDDVVQQMPVVQMATRLVRNVRFDGSAQALRLLILQWGAPSGVSVTVTQTDFVGGNYDVRFTRSSGTISLATARDWVQRGLDHAGESSSEESSGEDSD